MTKTKIEWADSTWNPVSGCQHGCPYCYAREMARRFGTGWQECSKNEIHELDKPMKGFHAKNKKVVTEPYPYDFAPTLHAYRLDQPQKWVTPRTIFVCSMADLFGDWIPDGWLDEVFTAAEKADRHRHLFLTKNPKRYTDYGVPIDENKWYGTTITSDTDADRFNQLPAFANTFVSAEPLLGDFAGKHNVMFRQIDWIIIGAESGRRKDKITPEKEWIENITREADKHGVPVFMKDSLIKCGTLTEEEMRREFPWEVRTLMSPAKEAGQPGDLPTLMSGT